MYTEEYDKRPFPFRDFLLKFIMIVIFALFLVWLIPKFISPKTSGNEATSSKVFEKNLTAMKTASVNYYSKKENLPTDNSKEVITLRQMISKNMLRAFTDKNGKACNVDKSYSEITSDNGEYVLKVKLKCSDEEDYALTKIGSYSYCTSEICEKDEESEPSNTVVNYTYEYQKTTAGTFSSWGDWSGKTKNSERYKEITCATNDSSCLKEIKVTTRREVIGKTPLGQNAVATVSYYQTRTRTYTPGVTDTKWSSENDETLLNSGYKMTGNKKELN